VQHGLLLGHFGAHTGHLVLVLLLLHQEEPLLVFAHFLSERFWLARRLVVLSALPDLAQRDVSVLRLLVVRVVAQVIRLLQVRHGLRRQHVLLALKMTQVCRLTGRVVHVFRGPFLMQNGFVVAHAALVLAVVLLHRQSALIAASVVLHLHCLRLHIHINAVVVERPGACLLQLSRRLN